MLIEPIKDKFGKGGLDDIYLYDAEKNEIVPLTYVKNNLVEYIENEYYYEIPDFYVFFDARYYSKEDLNKLKKNLIDSGSTVIFNFKGEGG